MKGRRLLFAALPLLGLLLLGELLARLAGAPDCEPIIPAATGWDTMVGDPRYLWKLEPNRVFTSPNGDVTRINAVGLRTRSLPTDAKQPGELRVLVTGDSSVYGWGQPDGHTYAEQLEAALGRAIRGRKVTVVNLGVPGYSTEQTLRLLDDVGWAYQPDLLIVHNIFSDCNIDAFQDEDALALANPEGSAGRRALHASRLYCAAYMPWARYQATMNQEPNRVLMPGIPTGKNAAVALERIDEVIDLSRVPLGDYLDNLNRIREGAVQRGARVMLAPLAQEWDVGLWKAPMDPPKEGQVLPWTPYRDAQKRWAEERSVVRVDLPAAFKAARGDPNRLFIDNMHPSVEGAAVMVEAELAALREHPELLGLAAGQIGPAGPASPGPGAQAPGVQPPGAQPPGVQPPGVPPPGVPPQSGAQHPPPPAPPPRR